MAIRARFLNQIATHKFSPLGLLNGPPFPLPARLDFSPSCVVFLSDLFPIGRRDRRSLSVRAGDAFLRCHGDGLSASARFSRQLHSSPSSYRHSGPTKRGPKPPKVIQKKPTVEVWRGMTVGELAAGIEKTPSDVCQFLRPSMNDVSGETRLNDLGLIQELCRPSKFRCKVIQRYDIKPETDCSSALDAQPRPPPTQEEHRSLPKRHPVVTIMGHVDHGKTTLLDRLRRTNVVSEEFGGITQHIGAFSARLSSGSRIVFLDTPGHAAFTAMRGRGANVTDVVVLVIAAEDGVMNQTLESIEHARQSGVPIVVAINKIDKAEADVDGTKRELLEAGIQLEDFGGDVMCVPISALKGTNLDELMEAVLTQADLLDLRADPSGLAEGTVIETRQVEGLGKTVMALMQRGCLKIGSFLVAGNAHCKVRSMTDDTGRALSAVEPFEPVEITGWKELPSPGDKVLQVESERRLKQVVKFRDSQLENQRFLEAQVLVQRQKQQDEENYRERVALKIETGRRRLKIKDFRKEKELKTVDFSNPFLHVVIRADVDGSLEAILGIFDSYADEKCKLDILNFGVGPPTPSDIDLAKAFHGIVYSFNQKVPDSVEQLAERENVEINHFNVIYRLFEHAKSAMESRLPPLSVPDVVGRAEVLQSFSVTDVKRQRAVAGCRCLWGELNRAHKFKLVRGDKVLFDGDLHSLRHFKEEVKTISHTMECGVALADGDLEPLPGDELVCYVLREEKQSIHWNLDFS